MEKLSCFKSFVLHNDFTMTYKQMNLQHQLIMNNLVMKAFETIIN